MLPMSLHQNQANSHCSDCTQGRAQKCYVSYASFCRFTHGLTQNRTVANKVTCLETAHPNQVKSASATSVRSFPRTFSITTSHKGSRQATWTLAIGLSQLVDLNDMMSNLPFSFLSNSQQTWTHGYSAVKNNFDLLECHS